MTCERGEIANAAGLSYRRRRNAPSRRGPLAPAAQPPLSHTHICIDPGQSSLSVHIIFFVCTKSVSYMYQTRIRHVSSMVQILIRTDKKDRLIRTVFGLIRAALEEELWIRLTCITLYHKNMYHTVSYCIILVSCQKSMIRIIDVYHSVSQICIM